jgi:hypothetical protein
MRIARFLVCLSVVAFVPGMISAQDIKATTEFGITISPDQITDAIQETQDFWVPVRNYVASEAFQVATPETRTQAVTFIKKVHDELHHRLFEMDEATGHDLITYLTHRLRKFEIYRQLRAKINNDAALSTLVERWEKSHRDINLLPETDRAARVQELVALMPEEMSALGLSSEVVDAAKPLWDTQAKCLARMAETGAGKMMISYEHEARKLAPEVGELVRQVTTAADWALITKAGTAGINRKDFNKAWTELAELRGKRLAVSKPAGDLK